MKTILLTGATDGIGLETAKLLAAQGHKLLLHGRNPTKLAAAKSAVEQVCQADGETPTVETYVADFSKLGDVNTMAQQVLDQHKQIDVLLNNAGVFKLPYEHERTGDGLDARFAVNTLAPYLLTKRLLPLIPPHKGRVINLSSAAQSPVNLMALAGSGGRMQDFSAYAQSKLAITMWTHYLSQQAEHKQVFVAVNPASMIGTKMVKEGFGVPNGKSLSVGADILVEAALGSKFGSKANGKYFNNDIGHFDSPHSDASNPKKEKELVEAMEQVLAGLGL